MIVRMIHEDHGATYVYDAGQRDRLKALGWKVEGEKVEPVVGVDTDGDGVIDKPFRKPGRPKKAD
jgi:hypothetical protein